MKNKIYLIILISALSSCYKENGEPLRNFDEIELGFEYDTISCQTFTAPNQAMFSSSPTQNYTAQIEFNGFRATKVSSSDIYTIIGRFISPPNKSVYYLTTSGIPKFKDVRLLLLNDRTNTLYECEIDKKVYVKRNSSGNRLIYFCGGTFFNTSDILDSVVLTNFQIEIL